MKRKIKFKDWDREVLTDLGARFSPAAVELIDGQTLEAYAGSVPPLWNGEIVEVLDCFESKKLERYHPDEYRACKPFSLHRLEI